MAKNSLFDILDDISYNKKEILQEEEDFKEYNPFMINRFLSMDGTTLFLADFINRISHIPKKMQYLFYLFGIDKKKRFFKYQKKGATGDNIKLIKKYYNCNDRKALEILDILSETQIKEIKKTFKHGK